MATVTNRRVSEVKTPEQEVQRLRATAKRILRTKKSALRFILALGMHEADGRLKPEFR